MYTFFSNSPYSISLFWTYSEHILNIFSLPCWITASKFTSYNIGTLYNSNDLSLRVRIIDSLMYFFSSTNMLCEGRFQLIVLVCNFVYSLEITSLLISCMHLNMFKQLFTRWNVISSSSSSSQNKWTGLLYVCQRTVFHD